MSENKNIIFDLDGTLADSLPGIQLSIVYALRKQGHAVDDTLDIKPLIGPPMDRVFTRLLAPFGDDRVKIAVDSYRDNYKKRGLLATKLYSGIPEMLSELRESGYKLFIATSKRQTFAEEIIKNTNIIDSFVYVQGTTPDGKLDNKIDLVRELIVNQGLVSENTILIGDRKDDVEAAIANNIPVIGAQWGYENQGELKSAGANYLCHQPSAIPPLISSILKL